MIKPNIFLDFIVNFTMKMAFVLIMLMIVYDQWSLTTKIKVAFILPKKKHFPVKRKASIKKMPLILILVILNGNLHHISLISFQLWRSILL